MLKLVNLGRMGRNRAFAGRRWQGSGNVRGGSPRSTGRAPLHLAGREGSRRARILPAAGGTFLCAPGPGATPGRTGTPMNREPVSAVPAARRRRAARVAAEHDADARHRFHWPVFIPACITIPRYISLSSGGVHFFLELFWLCTVFLGQDGMVYAAELPAEHLPLLRRSKLNTSS